MKALRFVLSFLALILVASMAVSCGSSQRPGQLQTITVAPAVADAQAQFTATGYYINPSHTVTPQPANWGACFQGAPTTDVSVTTNGKAQCASGATGTYTVFASVAIGGQTCAVNACGGGCTITGSAQLTCP